MLYPWILQTEGRAFWWTFVVSLLGYVGCIRENPSTMEASGQGLVYINAIVVDSELATVLP